MINQPRPSNTANERIARIYKRAVVTTVTGAHNAHIVEISSLGLHMTTKAGAQCGDTILVEMELERREQHLLEQPTLVIQARIAAIKKTSACDFYTCDFMASLTHAQHRVVSDMVRSATFTVAPLPWLATAG